MKKERKPEISESLSELRLLERWHKGKLTELIRAKNYDKLLFCNGPDGLDKLLIIVRHVKRHFPKKKIDKDTGQYKLL